MGWRRPGTPARAPASRPAHRLRPRRAERAAPALALLFAAGAGMIVVGAALTPRTDNRLDPALLTLLTLACLGTAAVLRLSTGLMRDVALICAPVFGSFVIMQVDLVTQDASAAAQVIFCLPVIYGAMFLPPPLAWMSTLGAIICESVVAFSLLPIESSVNDIVFVPGTLCLLTYVMLQAQAKEDALVARLEQQATVDALTGLATRRVLNDAVAAVASPASARQAGTSAALALIDVDDFKQINDAFGHPTGDDALVLIARLLRHHTPEDAVICRLGGDEFAVLFRECLAGEAAQHVEGFLAALRANPLTVVTHEENVSVTVSVSVGVSDTGAVTVDYRDLYGAADAALYAVKRTGGGTVRIGNGERKPAGPVRSL